MSVKIIVAQINPVVGDIAGNTQMIIAHAITARDELGGDLIIFPELVITAYPAEDLLLRTEFIAEAEAAVEHIKNTVQGIYILLGYPRYDDGCLYNAAALIYDGQMVASYHKQGLPNYSVFDEQRYFTPGHESCVVTIKGIKFGLTICEDIWLQDVVKETVVAGAEVILNINASPFHANKHRERIAALKQRVDESGVPVIYVNQLGGQDELVFDGGSFVIDAEGEIAQCARPFEQGLYPVLASKVDEGAVVQVEGDEVIDDMSDQQRIYGALVLGVRDYVRKNGFSRVIVGLSGGIDSALTIALAVDALGAENVSAVMMPSPYTAQMSITDARAIAENLDIKYREISIEPVFEVLLQSLAEEFEGLEKDVTEENLQARCRGILLMAISNKKNSMLLTTGNKSEMAVGYATLYGDMAGGFAPLKDVSKTLVYALTRYRNSVSNVIPQRVITRPPTAELAPDQIDEDSLPPYDILDAILELYVEKDASCDDIVGAGYDVDTVRRVIAMVDRNEYKRRQSPPGIKITQRAFGRDRRYPITSRYTASR